MRDNSVFFYFSLRFENGKANHGYYWYENSIKKSGFRSAKWFVSTRQDDDVVRLHKFGKTQVTWYWNNDWGMIINCLQKSVREFKTVVLQVEMGLIDTGI